MNWIIENESPVGYEPVYSVMDKTTGRRIATDLEKDEALKIANCEELTYLLKDLVEVVDELYVNTIIKDEEHLKYINGLIKHSQKVLSKIEVK
jgi:hypothetical protein